MLFTFLVEFPEFRQMSEETQKTFKMEKIIFRFLVGTVALKEFNGVFLGIDLFGFSNII